MWEKGSMAKVTITQLKNITQDASNSLNNSMNAATVNDKMVFALQSIAQSNLVIAIVTLGQQIEDGRSSIEG